MPESGQPSERSSQNHVRIVYHAGSRTFARLFNEHSLEEVKDVVRRKLGLGSETDVSLKQMGSDALLDLEDDGDFQAFRVFLQSSVSVDIQVTVGESRGSTVPLTDLPQSGGQPSTSKPTTTVSSMSPSREPSDVAASGQRFYPRKRPLTTPLTMARKRKVSFEDAGTSASDKPAERGILPEHIAVTPAASAETAGSSAAPKQTDAVEPPKKKTRKESTKTKPTERGVPPEPVTVTPVASGKTAETVELPKKKTRKEPTKTKDMEQDGLAEGITPNASGKIADVVAPKPADAVEIPKEKTRKEPTKTKLVEQDVLMESITPDASAKAAKSPAAPLRRVGGAAPRKLLAKTPTEKKDVKATEAVESPATKDSVSKPKAKKSTTLDHGGEGGSSAPKDTETSQLPVKKQRKRKTDDSTGSKKFSVAVDQDVGSNRASNSENEASLQLESSAEGGVSETLKSGNWLQAPKGMVCAFIPQTSASTVIRSEVAAAILSGYLPKLPEPPAKRKYVDRDTKKSTASSTALPAEPTTVLDVSVNDTLNLSIEHGIEQAHLTNEPQQQTPDSNSLPCPICLQEPFHIRYYCPIILKGSDTIRERLEELERTNTGDQQPLIKQLKGLLRESEVKSKRSAPTDGVQPENVLPPPSASLPGTPNIPTNSYLSEVTVEGRDEGSSSEGSDSMSERGVEPQRSSAPQRQKTPHEQPLPSNDDLDAIVRGPVSKRQSVLHLLDRIACDEDDEDSDSEEDLAELEEDPDEETGRLGHRSFRRVTRSSASEDEEEDYRSPSPSRSDRSTPDNLGPGVQGSNKSVDKSTEHNGANVVMRESVGPPVFEGQDDDDEKTHVGSEDRMAVDEITGEKGVATGVRVQFSPPVSRASILQTSDAPCNEPQEPATTQVDPTPDQDGSVLETSKVLKDIEADPIEPADDLEPPVVSGSSNADPIEVPSEDIGSLFASVTRSYPKPGVSKRIKTRNGQIPDDEADRPVLLEQLVSEAMNEVTPIPAKGNLGKSRKKLTISQEPTSARMSPQSSSLPASTSTPAAVALLNHRSKYGTRTGKGVKTPAKQFEDRSDASRSSANDGGDTQNMARIASLIGWETLAEPSSPSIQLDDPSGLIDELMSSSPHPDDNPVHPNNKEKKGRPRKSAKSSQAESSQGKERLFDLSSSQIPFPYSLNQTDSAPAVLLDGRESKRTTDSEEEPKVAKKKTKTPVRYRPLSQIASQAALFSPSLPTPTNRPVTNGKVKKLAVDEVSSSSSSSDMDEVNGSGHIPRGRRAGSALETKRKSLLSKI